VTGWAHRLHFEEESVSVAIDGDVDEAKHVAACLALPPKSIPRTAVEVDLASGKRGSEGLSIYVSHHEDPAVGDVLDDSGDEATGAPGQILFVHCLSTH
jgi:hypothetical protein